MIIIIKIKKKTLIVEGYHPVLSTVLSTPHISVV